ncbi:MAG: hypothetical protein ACJ78Q_07545 [Chloroflexia bacterium]
MNSYNSREQGSPESARLDSIIEEYLASSPGPNREILARWVRLYPQYERELTELTANWTVIAPGAPPPIGDIAEHRQAAARHMNMAQAILDRSVAQSQAAPAPLKGLVAAGQARGLSRKQLAATLGLSIALVEKLDRRLIDYATIPAAIVESISRTLATGKDAVERYLQGPSLLPQAASYKAGKAPTVPPPQSFAEAVESDRTLPEERKRALLGMR